VRRTRVVGCSYYHCGCWLPRVRPQALGTGGAGGDRFGVWACFGEEERSDTYAEQEVGKCPECGAWLKTDALLGAYEWVVGR
jgi:hypothetical protein